LAVFCIYVVSLHRTLIIFFNFISASDGESVEFPGMAIAHLAADPNCLQKSGKILSVSDLAKEYGFVDLVYFNLQFLGKFWRALEWKMFKYFTAIFCVFKGQLVHFSRFGMFSYRNSHLG
jgi:hypothetical protein